MVPIHPPPNFLAPHPAKIVLKNPFIVFVFKVYLKLDNSAKLLLKLSFFYQFKIDCDKQILKKQKANL